MNVLFVLPLVVLIIELILRLYESSKQIVPPDLTQYPFYRWHKKNTFGRDLVYTQTIGKALAPKVKTHSEGIRGDIETEKRNIILALGCSFTEGNAFINSETYPGQLQKLVDSNETAVINGGIAGYGIFQIENLLRTLTKYKPKIVIIQLPDLRRIPFNSQNLIEGKKEFIFYQRLKRISVLLWYLSKVKPRTFLQNLNMPYRYTGALEEAWNLNKKYLDKITQTCKKNQIKPILFVWSMDQYLLKKVREYAMKNHIITFDAGRIFPYYTEEELQIKHDGHPSALANKLIAKAAYHCLLKNKLI